MYFLAQRNEAWYCICLQGTEKCDMLQTKKSKMLKFTRLQNLKQYILCIQLDVSEYDPTLGCTVRSS